MPEDTITGRFGRRELDPEVADYQARLGRSQPSPITEPGLGFGIPGYEDYARPNYGPGSQGGWENQRDIRGALPYKMLDKYANVAQYGIYGKGGVGDIMRNVGRSNAQRRRALAKGLMRKYGRRLGSRSGGIQTMIANQVHAPGLAGEASTRASLMSENLKSRFGGLEGMQAIMRFLEAQYGAKKGREQADSSGWLDWIGPVSDLAAVGIDIFGGGGAATAANQARKRVNAPNRYGTTFGGGTL